MTCFNKKNTIPPLRETQHRCITDDNTWPHLLQSDRNEPLLLWSFISPQRRMAIRCVAKFHLFISIWMDEQVGCCCHGGMWNCGRHAGLIQTAFDVGVKWAGSPEFIPTHVEAPTTDVCRHTQSFLTIWRWTSPQRWQKWTLHNNRERQSVAASVHPGPIHSSTGRCVLNGSLMPLSYLSSRPDCRKPKETWSRTEGQMYSQQISIHMETEGVTTSDPEPLNTPKTSWSQRRRRTTVSPSQREEGEPVEAMRTSWGRDDKHRGRNWLNKTGSLI